MGMKVPLGAMLMSVCADMAMSAMLPTPRAALTTLSGRPYSPGTDSCKHIRGLILIKRNQPGRTHWPESWRKMVL